MEKSKFLKLKKSFPESPGIYKFLKNREVVYVGKAVNIRKRLESYFSIKLQAKTAKMVKESDQVSVISVTSELEALLLEAKLIKAFQPKYNFISKDDKHALYIKIFDLPYPIIKPVRKNDDENTLSIFGPFPSSQKVYAVLRFLRKLFPYSDHKIGKRLCIYNQIGLCSPCPNAIEQITNIKEKQQEKKKYLKNIYHIQKVLEGKINKVIKTLGKDMKILSKKQQYEEASKVKTQIENLRYITQKSVKEDVFLSNPNLSIDLRLKEINSLKKILKLGTLTRIECYDVSHISGYLATASMVTFIKGIPDKSLYRRFRLIGSANNDTKSLKEIAERRLKNMAKWGKPDLILVDGGKNQLNVFKKVFLNEKIPIFAITKGREQLDYPDSDALNLIIRIRDESHRFAKKYHDLLFRKNLIKV